MNTPRWRGIVSVAMHRYLRMFNEAAAYQRRGFALAARPGAAVWRRDEIPVAWMVIDAKGKPAIETHPWGKNFILSHTMDAACKWNAGEKVVRVEIKWQRP